MAASNVNLPTTTSVPSSARRLRLGAVVVVAWLAWVSIAALAALVDRPAYSGTQAGTWIVLVWFSVPVVTLGVFAMRTPAILVTCVTAAAAFYAWGSWSTLRSTGSTAAVGIAVTPFVAFLIVALGAFIDALWSSRSRSTA